jgi:hypothetical protein
MTRALAYALGFAAVIFAAIPQYREARALTGCDAACVEMMGEK